MSYQEMLVALAIDCAAIAILVFGIYFPRHQRRDLLLAFLGVNFGLFAVATFVVEHEVGLGAGLGLFALLSVVRLRSSEIAQEEIGYYFVSLVLGLINGFAGDDDWARTVTLDLLLLGAMYVADHPRLFANRRQQTVTLDAIFPTEAGLRAELERLLGGSVTRAVVLRTDFVHNHTVVDVRWRVSDQAVGEGAPR